MFDLDSLSNLREGNKLEAKLAAKGLPKNLFDSYSAFANTDGGTILLGVEELRDHSLVAAGIDSPDNLLQDFWNVLNNPQAVSANILTNDDVSIEDADGASIIVINVPRADVRHRPVYVRGNPFTGTFRRNGEGDYHCSEEDIRAMIRDSGAGDADRAALSEIGRDALCAESIQAYRNDLRTLRPRHAWNSLSDNDFLMRIGALACVPEDGDLHPTRAGLLMFGYDYEIVREYPYYLLDYRDVFTNERWDDRIVSGLGEWSGNVYDFWRTISARLMRDLPRPFALDDKQRRIDDTPLHKAVREALANTLIHADYYGRANTVIIHEAAYITFTNPGGLRMAADVAQAGGYSDTRNPVLMTMFNLIAVGERAGSGFDGMRAGCDFAQLPYPELSELYEPDATRLVFHLRRESVSSTQADSASYDPSLPPEDTVKNLAREQGYVTRRDVEHALGLGRSSASALLKQMVAEGTLRSEGAARSTRYVLAR